MAKAPRGPDPRALPGSYAGIPTMFRRPLVTPAEPGRCDVAYYGLPFDSHAGTRGGARLGPRAVRAASLELWWGETWPWGFDPFARLAAVDAGDVTHPNSQYETFFPAAEQTVSSLAQAGAVPIGIGGDHSTTLPALRVLAGRHGPLAMVQVDAHADTSQAAHLTHGTVFRQAIDERLLDPTRVLQVGIRTAHERGLGIHVWDAAAIARTPDPAPVFRRWLDEVIAGPTYVTVDIDALDPAFAPGTGTPIPGGLTPAQLLAMLRELWRVAVVGADVVEIAPELDGSGRVTALQGAAAILEITCAIAAEQAVEL